MKKQLLFVFMFLGSLSMGFSQTVSIINKKFVVNGNASCPIYFNGANTPWNNWNDFGGNYNSTFWSTHFATLKANGINASRVWISCNGDVQPNINTDGTVTGVSTQFWTNLDDFFQSAQNNGIYIMATMMSFDHTKNTYVKYQSWRNMLNDQAKVQTYCTNYLVPFVNRYKSNPYLMSIDISNEIEWVAEDNNNMKCSYAVLQRFVAMCASAIHNNPRTDGSTVLVTMGSAATKWNATKMRAGENGAWSQNNSDGNKWSDAALKAQYNQANAILDFYSPHYYAWVDTWYSNPYVRTPTDFGIDEKAVLIGETPAGNPGTPNLTALASYEALKNNGYQGHFPWTSNGVDALGDISKFGTDAKTFATTYSSLVKPTCAVACVTTAPLVPGSVLYCQNATATALYASGTALKWYADNTTTTALPAAPIPGTSTVGTTNYYVSQTYNGCEGPRAVIPVTINPLPVTTISTTTPTAFCAGGSVTLSINASTGLSYYWNNAAGIIPGATNASYTATTSDSYQVTAYIISTKCSATSTAKTVTVNALPTAAITTTTPTTFCAGKNVTLTSSAGTAYQWNNAAGIIPGATNSTYVATTSGAYTVKVTNSNTCSATSAPTQVTVNPLPTAAISTTTSTTFCSGETIVLTSSAGASYKWFKGTTQVSGTSQTYTVSSPGNYTVEVTNANGCVATSAPTTVTINSVSIPSITTTTSTTICAGGSVLLTASPGGSSYRWFRGTGPVGTGQTYLATVAGSYTVEVTNSNNCAATSSPTMVTINAVPLPVISTTTPTTFCEGGNVLMTSSPGSSYKWFRGTTQVAATQAYSATVSGSYTVEVTNANNCVMTSSPRIIIVHALPTATIAATTSTTFCANGSVVLTSSSGSSYKWFRGTTQVATSQTYLATIAGSYTVEVTNENNCTAISDAAIVTINDLPTATISTTAPTTFCEGGSVLLTASTGSSYKWFRGTTPVATGQTYVATTAGGYTVEVTNANNCTVASAIKNVIVHPLPTALIGTTTSTAICSGESVLLTSSPGTSYQWFRGTTQLSATQTYLATIAGSYTVEVTNANNCTALSEATLVTVSSGVTWYQDLDGDGKGDADITQTACTQPTGYVSVSGDACPADANKLAPGICGCGIAEGTCPTTGIVDLKSTDEIKIMPNPSSDQFNLILAESAAVYISTVEGKQVDIFTDVKDVKFGADYAKGVYIIQIMNGSTTQVVRVIKQ